MSSEEISMRQLTLRALGLLCLVLTSWGAPAKAQAPSDDSATILYRDEYGIPHVYAPTLEASSYAIGYAQAEDRLEELLKNYRRAAGTMAEVFGPRFYESDVAQRVWRHEEISRTRYHLVSPKLRAVLEAYVAGVQRFMKDHPDRVPA